MMRSTSFGLYAAALLLSAVTLPAAEGNAPLADAMEKLDRAAVRTLLQRRVDVNAPQVDGMTALHWAAYQDDAESVELLLGAGANVRAANRYGITPLTLAITDARFVDALAARAKAAGKLRASFVVPDSWRRNTPQALAEAERFALTDYLTTLAGAAPEGDAARAFYQRVAQMTGLPVDVVARARGFVRDAYIKHARPGDRAVVSSYDASFITPDPFPESESPRGPDPILDGLTRAYGGAFVGYARGELGFKTEMTYQLLAHDVNNKWDWGGGGRRTAPSASRCAVCGRNPTPV